ncbi:MAG: phosphatidylserine decarboxylase [Candidatus Margulisiibacteriota bacterium]
MLIISLYILLLLLVFGILLLLFFLRNPDRTPPHGDLILSPADGLVVDILEEGNWIKIIIFMNFLNVHVQWVPYPGKVTSIEKFEGPAKPGFLPEASKNKQVVSRLDTKIGEIILKQIVGILVRRIETFAKVGKEVKIGQRFGRIVFGSRVELWLPQGRAEVKVSKGQRVLAGVTVAALPK